MDKICDGLRAPKHQRRDERHRLRRHPEDALDVVCIAHHPSAARLDDERQHLQVVEDRLHLGLARVEDGVAARLLVAAGDERVEREGIAVGDGVLLLDEDADDARLEQ